jgi:hypothetical protein
LTVYKESDVLAVLSEIYVDVLGNPVAERTLLRIKQTIRELPVEDVEPVVRCRNCAVPHNRRTGCPVLGGKIPPDTWYCASGKRKDGTIPDHWAELFKAEAEGRLVVLPCKVGDTIYILRGDGNAAHADALRVVAIRAENSTFTRWIIRCVEEDGDWSVLYFGGYGRTVFRTKEEAEAALERSKSDGD